MSNEENKTKKSFFKTPLGIVIAILFLPFFLTYWIYKQKWDPKLKWGLIGGMWILGGIFMMINSSYQKGYEAAQKTSTPIETASSQTNVTQAPTVPVQHASPAPVVTYPPYNKNKGNNYVAAKYAQQFMDVADKAASGYITDTYLELSPEDPKGKAEDDYRKSISSAFLTVMVDPSYWNTTDDETKKDIVAALTTAVKNNFGGFPHIKTSNGVRTVAEGEWSVWNGEAKVTLK